MVGLMHFNVEVDADGDGYVATCPRIGTYRWRGATADAALNAFADDMKDLMARFHRTRPPRPQGFHPED